MGELGSEERQCLAIPTTIIKLLVAFRRSIPPPWKMPEGYNTLQHLLSAQVIQAAPINLEPSWVKLIFFIIWLVFSFHWFSFVFQFFVNFEDAKFY